MHQCRFDLKLMEHTEFQQKLKPSQDSRNHFKHHRHRVGTQILTGSFVKAGLVTCFPKASSWNCSSCTTSPAKVLLVGASAWTYCKKKKAHFYWGEAHCWHLSSQLQDFGIPAWLEGVLHRRRNQHKHFSSFRLKIQHSPVARAHLLRAGIKHSSSW